MTAAFRPIALTAVAVVAVSLCSCAARFDGLSGAEAAGKATLNGKPFTAGTVVFVGESSSTAAEIQPDGSYRATNVPIGPVRVAIVTTGPSAPLRGGQGPAPQVPPPQRYRSISTSGLGMTAKSGENLFDIPMTTR